MKIDLAVIGQGAVTPAGIGVGALLHRQPTISSVAALGQPGQTWPVLRVDLKDPAFARWQREPRLRRASPITFFLVEAAEQALGGVSPVDRAETGLIVAFSAGCLVYSRRFFEGISRQGQKTASPALFPETVFNSPVSHVASVLGLNGAAYAVIGDETAWVSALQTASIWLRQGRVKQVLVLGAEEFDPIVLDAYRSARWLRRNNSAGGFLTSEGAAGILVRKAGPGEANVITTARDGWIYRTRREVSTAAENLLSESDPALPCYPSAQQNWLGSLEKKATENRAIVSTQHQPYLGEAFTASAAWHTLRALACLDDDTPRILVPVWGLNHQLGLLELQIQE
jgi:3-oxoacyl-[acyl-carrier-protein] synthase III